MALEIDFNMLLSYWKLGLVFGICLYLLVFMIYNRQVTEKMGKGILLMMVVCIFVLFLSNDSIGFINKIKTSWVESGLGGK